MYKVTITFKDHNRTPQSFITDVAEAPNLFDMATGKPAELVVFNSADGTLHQFHAQDIFHIAKKLSTSFSTGSVPGMYGVAPTTPLAPAPTKSASTVSTGGMATDFGAIADAMRKKGIN